MRLPTIALAVMDTPLSALAVLPALPVHATEVLEAHAAVPHSWVPTLDDIVGSAVRKLTPVTAITVPPVGNVLSVYAKLTAGAAKTKCQTLDENG